MDRPGLKVLFFSPGYTPHDRRFLASLSNAGMDVVHLRLTGETAERRPYPAGVTCVEGCAAHGLRRLLACAGLLRRIHPDVAIAGPIQSCALLTACVGYRPFIAMSWGSDMLVDASRTMGARLVTRFALARAAGALGDCEAVRRAFRRFSRLPDERIVTFPWGLERAYFEQARAVATLRHDLGWEDKTVLVSTRSWEPIYAVDLLIKAFARVRERYPAARLLLVGDGSQADAIRRLVSDLGLASSIHMAGRVGNDRMAGYLRSADLYVSAALSDGTSVSLLEAMAAGLPVVVTRAHGNVEWVEPGRNGWLAWPGDAASLSAAMVEALSDPSVLKDMGRRNETIVRDKADWEANFQRLVDLIRRVAA